MTDMLKPFRAKIRKYGWVLSGTAPTVECASHDCCPGHAPEVLTVIYTAGLTVAGLPELMMTGEKILNEIPTILNHAAKASLAVGGDGFTHGQELRLPDYNPDLVFRVVHVRHDARIPTVIANKLYGPRVRRVQILWPDSAGRFPGDTGCTLTHHDQPRAPLGLIMQVAPVACPYCAHTLDAAMLNTDNTGVPNDGSPEEGDFTVCAGCRRMLVYVVRSGSAVLAPSVGVRVPQPEELAAGLAEPDFGRYLTGERAPDGPVTP